MEWIFTILIGALMGAVLAIDDIKIKSIFIVIQIILLIAQIIYTFTKD